MRPQTSSDPVRTGPPQGWRTLRHFAYVDRPFRAVRRSVAAAPQRLLAGPPDPGEGRPGRARLRVRRAGFDLTRDVRMVLGDVEIGVHSARLPIRWEDATRPGLFPILDAVLEVAPVRAGRHAMTQLGLYGRYRPPFGRIGGLADDVAGHRIVVDSVEGFLDGLVARFEADLAVPDPEPEADDRADGRPGRRRIVLPVDGLDHVEGGAAGLVLRLLGAPGVFDATVNPASGLAVVDYDPAACSAAGLLDILEAEQ